jgi:signal peptidase I
MNLETIGWTALALSGALILAGFFAGSRSSAAPSGAVANAGEGGPLHGWLEIAWPVFFIASMGMLTLKEVMSFAAVLLLATVLTGIVWAADHWVLARRRAKDAAEPIVVEMARSFFPVIAIVFLLRSFLYEPFKIPSESMLPTLEVGDFILVNKFTYGIRIPVINHKVTDGEPPKRGDVMVFRYPVEPHKDFIKRIVAVGGDRIEYRDKRLRINGVEVPLVALGSEAKVDERLGIRRFDSFREKLGEKEHRIYSVADAPSVNLGSVRRFPNHENCAYNNEGVVCTVPAGHFFMMGDNRDNSDDSRYWGFVPEKNIVGKAVAVWMNFGSWKRIFTRIE